MPETIAFKGLTTDTPEGFNPDGELAVSHNIILEDGALHPIMPPKPFGISHMNKDRDLVFIHKSASFEHDHYIIFQKTDSTLHFYNEVFAHDTVLPKPPATTMPIDPEIKPMAAAVAASEEETDDTYPPLIAITTEPVEGLKDIAAIGNTLVITTSAGVAYAVWEGDKYNYLGTSMPQVNIEFSLGDVSCRSRRNVLCEFSYTRPSDYWINKSDIPWSNGEYNKKGLDEVLAKILPDINEYITSKGRFYQPFFIRYALRLYDGSYAYHSAPVLMVPTVGVPVVNICSRTHGTNIFTFRCNYLLFHYALLYRTLAAELQKLELWKDIITGIDFFISAPIYTYSQSLPPAKDSLTVYQDLASVAIEYTPDDPDIDPDEAPSRGDEDNLPDLYYGTFCGKDHFYSKKEDLDIFPFERNPAFFDEITSCSQFYLLASVATTDISVKETFSPVPIKPSDIDLSNLQTRQTLKDDYLSRHSLIAGGMLIYNNRLQLTGVSLKLPEPFPIRIATQYLSAATEPIAKSQGQYTVCTYVPGDSTTSLPYLDVLARPFLLNAIAPEHEAHVITEISVICVKDGKELKTVLFSDNFNNSKHDLSPVSLAWDTRSFPRWLFYPDASATTMIIRIENSAGVYAYKLPLRQHPTLNGAYFFKGFHPESTIKYSIIDPGTPTVNNSLPQANKIYTSEVNNPFVFPPEGINSVGTGAVIAIATASRPLSQGQFGQFPLYAFTTEGIWALSVNEVGLYNTVQPISREVCLGADLIAPLDSTVAFISKRGVMLISGAEVDCISKNLDRAPALHSWSNPPFDMPEQLDFQEFVKSARIAYDYARQRLILINSEHSVAFVCSLKSGAWATMDSSLTEPLNTYPDTLIKGYVDGTQMLFDFDVSASDTTEAVIVTRPISFRAPHTLKTLRDIVLDADILPLGASRKEPWKAVIGVAGSRNLEHWHTFARRNGKGVRGVSGTPYQFHCLCISVPLTQYDSIIGATVEVVPKYTRKLR